MGVDWDHVLFIEIDHGERRISIFHGCPGSARCRNQIEADWLRGVDCLYDVQVLVMGVTKDGESDDVLISFDESFVP